MTASDVAYRWLHRSGWTIGDIASSRPPGVVWRVVGLNGETLIRAEGRTRDEAWKAALEQAVAAGMLADRGTPCQNRRPDGLRRLPSTSRRHVYRPSRNEGMSGRGSAAVPTTSQTLP